MAKKIGIIGSGVVARVLAEGFLKYGYPVTMGTRNPDKLKDWKQTYQAKVGSFQEAAAFGEIVVLAVKGTVAADVLDLIGDDYLKGKTVIDATNPIEEAAPENGVLRFFSQINRSLMEDLQEQHPEARLVKAFSCVGNAYMVDPDFDGQQPTMFIAGNHAGAKQEVAGILRKFGWDVADMGMAEGARAIEPLCMLWCIPGFRDNQWSHAFKMLRQ